MQAPMIWWLIDSMSLEEQNYLAWKLPRKAGRPFGRRVKGYEA